MPLKIVENQITFTATRGNEIPLRLSVEEFAESLCEEGFALGERLSVTPSPDRKCVILSGYFIGEKAWQDAWESENISIRESKRMMLRKFRGEPSVLCLQRSIAEPVPSCRCKGGMPTLLDIWCTPSSRCPPLLCGKGGIFPYYKLPLSYETRTRLSEWHSAASSICKMWDWDHGLAPYRKWAKQQLHSKTSDLSRFAYELSRVVTKETGIKTRAFCPPLHPFRL